MMKQITRGGVIAATAFISSHCDPPQEPAERPAQVIFVGEDYNFPFDARPGDTINLVMNPDDKNRMTAACDHAGGRLNYHGHTALYICEDVDF